MCTGCMRGELLAAAPRFRTTTRSTTCCRPATCSTSAAATGASWCLRAVRASIGMPRASCCSSLHPGALTSAPRRRLPVSQRAHPPGLRELSVPVHRQLGAPGTHASNVGVAGARMRSHCMIQAHDMELCARAHRRSVATRRLSPLRIQNNRSAPCTSSGSL